MKRRYIISGGCLSKVRSDSLVEKLSGDPWYDTDEAETSSCCLFIRTWQDQLLGYLEANQRMVLTNLIVASIGLHCSPRPLCLFRPRKHLVDLADCDCFSLVLSNI